LFHDVIYFPFKKDNELKSSIFAERLLKKYGFPIKDILIVKNLILSTVYPTNPKNKFQEIICDADISAVGTKTSYFLRAIENLRKEWGLSKEHFYLKTQPSFFKSFMWYTKSANKMGHNNFIKNKKVIDDIILNLKNSKKL